MGDESDEALWALVAGGEPRSYGVIWDRHSDRVFRHVIRLGGEPQDADGTTAQKSFTSPEDALKWQDANAGRTHTIPVYESNGTTVIGEFQIG